MATNLPVSRIIGVAVVITPAGAQAPQLNTGLVLGTSTVIDTVQRMRSYASLTAVGQDFSGSSQEYLAAVVWFGQNPQPTSLDIGRWVNVASAGQLIGGTVTAANQLLSAWSGITNGSLKVQVDAGAATNVTALNFSAPNPANLNGVAAIIQAGIQALGGVYAAVTCVWNSVYQRFVITSGTTGTSSTVGYLQAAGVGTDVSAMMMMLSTSAGVYQAPGLASETALAAVQLFDNDFGGQWYHLFIPSAVDSDHTAIAPYVDGGTNLHFYWINTQESAVLSPGDTTHIGYLLQQLTSQHAAWQYSSQSLYAVWSAAAFFAGINWAGSNTAPSLMYKIEPGVAPETLNETQANAIDAYNGNVLVTYANGKFIIEQGICPSGQFIDTIIGVDGLRGQMQVNLFNVLYTTPTKVPQTDAGVTTLETGCESACSQYVVNGLLAPGVWNSGGFGQLQQGQFLDKGYYIYAAPIATQSPAARAARVSPPIQVAAKLAGAIDDVSVTIYVNQ